MCEENAETLSCHDRCFKEKELHKNQSHEGQWVLAAPSHSSLSACAVWLLGFVPTAAVTNYHKGKKKANE